MTSKQKVLVVAGATVGTVGVGVIAYKLIKIHKLRKANYKKLDDIYPLTNKIGELFCSLQDTVYDDKTTDEMYSLIVEKCSEMLTNVKMFRAENSGIIYEHDNIKNCSSLVEKLISEYNLLFHDLTNSLSSPKYDDILDKYNEFYNDIYEKLEYLVDELYLMN